MVYSMKTLLLLKRPFIWISRFRKRCGYGVHSPFAFSLITDVFYEKRAYYSYSDLSHKHKDYKCSSGEDYTCHKVNKLLFRLVNRCQPNNVIAYCADKKTLDYLLYAKKSASLYNTSILEENTNLSNVDFVFINKHGSSADTLRAFNFFADKAKQNTLIVINGICYSKQMKKVWSKIVNDNRSGITFDLYDVGLVFFDKKKIKQDYTINF